MNQNRSIAAIDAPEFINIQPYNPLISQCEIKVLYLGENRNHSYISKNTAIQMANSLPGTPIVGAFREETKDFGDHGHIMQIENGEVHFSCKTIPYGFVAPDAEVWFKKFIDTDEFGNDVEREYLMTTGYLWTSQYKEAMSCISEGKGQSMELDEDTLDGHWASNDKSGIEFFIINDAVFSKLCILGDDVEPCFEGAAVTSPKVSSNFAYEAEFQQTLFSMINELKDALQNKGGSDMPKEFTSQEEQVEETVEEVEESTEGETDFTSTEYSEDGGDESGEDTTSEEQVENEVEDEPVVEEEKETSSATSVSEISDMSSEEIKVLDDDDETGEIKRKSNAFSEEEYQLLKQDYDALKEECESLRQFKLEIENEKKDALIAKYFMLDEKDKAEIIEHKSEYSYEDIESKLAVLYVQKNVDFTSLTEGNEDSEEENVEDPSTTFSLDSEVSGFVPSIVEVLRQTKQR